MNTIPRFLVRTALAVAVCSPLAVAQQPYGKGTPGTSGLTPQLSSIRPQLGNLGFGLDLQCAKPSTVAFLQLGLGSGSFPLQGIEVLLSPTQLVILLQGLVSAQGTARFPLPIPNLPALAGLPVFAQSAVVDNGGPAGLSASRGLRFAVSGSKPRVFVASSILKNDPFHYFDLSTGKAVDTGSPAQVDNATAAVFDEAGKRLFVASSIRATVGLGDTSKLPIRWSTLYTGSGSCYGLSHDVERNLLWTLTKVGGARELVAIDVDASSRTYGRARHNTKGVASGFYERWGMAPSGDVAGVLTLLPSTLTILDTNPKSSNFLKKIYSALPVPVDGSSPISLATQVVFTPDERYALVTIQLAGTTPAEVARLDLATGKWVDHNGTAKGVNIGALSKPAISFGSAPTTLRISNDGRFAIVGGFGGCGWVGRLDLDPKNPQSLAWKAFKPTAPLANGWTAALSPDETEIAVATWPATGCGTLKSPQLVRIAVATGAQLGVVAIPANSNRGNQNWYTVVYR
jgi:hypothetical protein